MRTLHVSRPVLALLSLLLVAVAPEPGERVGDPGEASAEISVVRNQSPRVPDAAVAKLRLSGHPESAQPVMFYALAGQVLGNKPTGASPRPRGTLCCAPSSRAPPSH